MECFLAAPSMVSVQHTKVPGCVGLYGKQSKVSLFFLLLLANELPIHIAHLGMDAVFQRKFSYLLRNIMVWLHCKL